MQIPWELRVAKFSILHHHQSKKTSSPVQMILRIDMNDTKNGEKKIPQNPVEMWIPYWLFNFNYLYFMSFPCTGYNKKM